MQSNSALVESHAVGAQVTVVQVLAHNRFGAIAYQWPQHWRYHWGFAKTASKKLTVLHDQVLDMEPGKNGMRFVADDTLLQDVYEVGNSMVSNAVRAVQHLAQDIGRVCKRNLCGATAQERISEAAAFFSTTVYHAEPDYAGLSEIIGIRDALEHPQERNTYSLDPGAWDRVPLAWMLSDRSLAAWERFDRWFRLIGEDWEGHLRLSKGPPVTLRIERGIESILPAKKPPRKSSSED